MSNKRYTLAEKIKICEEAVAAQKEGISLFKTFKKFNVSDVALYKWVDAFKLGELTGESEKEEPEIPSSLVEAVSDDCKRLESEKSEMTTVLVFAGSPENSFYVSVETPKTKDVDKFDLEMDRLVFDEIDWCYARKGFKSNKET